MSQAVSYEHKVSTSVAEGLGIQFVLSRIHLQVHDGLTLHVDLRVPYRLSLHICSALSGTSSISSMQVLRSDELDITRT